MWKFRSKVPPPLLVMATVSFLLYCNCVAQSLPPATESSQIGDPLITLRLSHPRLLAIAEDWIALNQRVKNDPDLARVIDKIRLDADEMLSEPPLEYKKQGFRLLDVSREAIRRIVAWGVMFRLTNNQKYSERARQEMLSLAAFQDWNPPHFLDVAEMITALAIGYDWFYGGLDASSRVVIREAIVEKGLKPGLDVVAKAEGWPRRESNWNQVCFAGLTLGALAIADEEPDLARHVLTAARSGIVWGLHAYAPDGVYPEGPSYWEYGTIYQILMVSALDSALGNSWDLASSRGFIPSAAVQLQLTGPSGKLFNFSDSASEVELQPEMFWFARRLRNPGLLYFQQILLKQAVTNPDNPKGREHEDRFFPLIAIWWSGAPQEGSSPQLPMNWKGDGRNPVGVFRSSWTDSNALYLAFKGGMAALPHGHMDAGSFILEADGIRWSVDLGKQNYFSIESKGIHLWNASQESDRWRIFRLNNFSHSTLVLGNELHRVGGDARIIEFRTEPTPSATLDLSPVFIGQAKRVIRRFELGADRTVLVRDELTGVKPSTEVRWAMMTSAQVEAKGSGAILKQGGKILCAKLRSPADAFFEVIPADPPKDDFNEPNPGISILIAKVKVPRSGRVDLEVVLHPESAHR